MCDGDSVETGPRLLCRDAEEASRAVEQPAPESGGDSSIGARWRDVDRCHQLFLELPQVLAVLGVLAISLWLKPDDRLYGTHQQLGFPPCASRVLLGIPCPSCGLTTSFTLMSHGQPVRAFKAHYLGPFLYTGMLVYLGFLITFLVRGQRLRFHWPKWVPYGLLFGGLGLYLLCWVIRIVQEM